MDRLICRVSRAGVVILVLMLCCGSSAAAGPKILVVIADDYGIDSHSLYNTNAAASLPATPNLNALAQRGVLFRNAYAQAVCSPSRCAMLTGRYSFRTGVTQPAGGTVPGVRTNEFTLAEVLADQTLGYAAASIGKWHLGGGTSAPRINGGWAHFSGSLGGAVQSYTAWTKTVNGVSTANHTTYATTDNVNDALAWIQQQGTNQWLLWLAFNAGHAPYHKPPNELHAHDSLSGSQADITANPRPYYEAMIEAMDSEMGRLMSQVNTNETVVFFLGDNGTPGRVSQAPYSSARGKDTLYEGGLRVPFIVAGPAIIDPGRTSDAVVHCADVYATVLELAGAKVPAGLPTDSRSLVPILSNEVFAPAEMAILSENETSAPMGQSGRAVRLGDFKLIRLADGGEEFYDLAADRFELRNLLAEPSDSTRQAAIEALRGKLAAWQNVPRIVTAQAGVGFSTEVQWFANANLSLWRLADVTQTNWARVTNAAVEDLGFRIRLSDSQPPAGAGFYRVQAQ